MRCKKRCPSDLPIGIPLASHPRIDHIGFVIYSYRRVFRSSACNTARHRIYVRSGDFPYGIPE